mmetsp:Transcript_18878/g.31213  ORF Transcript_18878/g.31213 Transcript_18878/m.31213 type:complete len:366 (-) Transcript_18878:314-1411(-)|eukprot:CAMPEP_0119012184 /NCGR_PEP_ID=MMETSP1176-20130426/6131_1 /TAXON_ID=265551 /ORGANISM="Synedropsis recta cf, Strain CCMP1620" /LENGTH=365 /DNA_ID=CAMNT_0006965103 /DNA_START=129 /DNA_END=1226 /DNA_ORIENTATION=-
MLLFNLCYDALKACFAPSSTSPNNNDEEQANERTALRSRGTVVLPPSYNYRRGFSEGFVSFFESKRGILFGFANLAIYYASAVIAFAFILETDWTVVDAIYFATVTFTTIGYGDITPSTDGGRLFTVIFSLYGIFILGFFAGLVGEKLVELHNAALKAMEDRGRKTVKEMFGASSSDDARPKRRTVCTIICDVLQVELPLICLILLLGICYGTLVEGWTVVESLYFATVTASTVGYGDFSPSEQWSRLLCVLLLPLAVTIFCEVLGRIAGVYLDYKIELQEEQFLHRQLTLSDLNSMDTDHDGNVNWGEFLVFMLSAMQKVDKEDIDQLRQVFEELDKSGTGQLDKNDIRGIMRQNTQRKLQVED